MRPGLRPAELEDCHGAGSPSLGHKAGINSSKNSCQTWRGMHVSVVPPFFASSRKAPCSLCTTSTQHPSGLPQTKSEEKASPQGVSMWLWSWGGPRCFPLGKDWSYPAPGTEMFHYSPENNFWYIRDIWHDFPSHAAGHCQSQWNYDGVGLA